MPQAHAGGAGLSGCVVEQAVGPGSVDAFILGQHGGGAARSIDDPLPAVATDGYITKIHPFLTVVIWDRRRNAHLPPPPGAPVTTKNAHPLLCPYAHARKLGQPISRCRRS